MLSALFQYSAVRNGAAPSRLGPAPSTGRTLQPKMVKVRRRTRFCKVYGLSQLKAYRGKVSPDHCCGESKAVGDIYQPKRVGEWGRAVEPDLCAILANVANGAVVRDFVHQEYFAS
jgi:hypothetical protein